MEVPCGGCFCRRRRGKVRAGSGVMYGAVIPGCAGRVSCDAVSYSVRRSGGVSRVPYQSVRVSPGICSPSVAAPGAALVTSARGTVRGGARPLLALQDSLLRGPGRRRGRNCPSPRPALLPRRPRRSLRFCLFVSVSGAPLRPHRRRHACHERALREQPGVPYDAIVSTSSAPRSGSLSRREPFLAPDIIRWFFRSTNTRLFHTSFVCMRLSLYTKRLKKQNKKKKNAKRRFRRRHSEET